VTRLIHDGPSIKPRDAPAVVGCPDHCPFKALEGVAAGDHCFGPSLVYGVRADQLIEHPAVGSLAGGHRQDVRGPADNPEATACHDS